jgi:hypothetical protein
MSQISQPVQDVLSQPCSSDVRPVESTSPAEDEDALNDDLVIEVAPNCTGGTIRVKLTFDGRSTPIPADDPWAE